MLLVGPTQVVGGKPQGGMTKKSPLLTELISAMLVDKLIAYGRWKLGETDSCNRDSEDVSQAFLALCAEEGSKLKSYTRVTGEVV